MKKKAAKRRQAHPSTPPELRFDHAQAEVLLNSALHDTTQAGLIFAERLTVVQSVGEFSQNDLAVEVLFRNVASAAGAGSTAFKTTSLAMLAARRAKEPQEVRVPVEIGTRVLTFKDSGRVTPQWKTIATEHAQILHAVARARREGDEKALKKLLAPFEAEFNQEVWEAAIRAGTKKSESFSPSVEG